MEGDRLGMCKKGCSVNCSQSKINSVNVIIGLVDTGTRGAVSLDSGESYGPESSQQKLY